MEKFGVKRENFGEFWREKEKFWAKRGNFGGKIG